MGSRAGRGGALWRSLLAGGLALMLILAACGGATTPLPGATAAGGLASPAPLPSLTPTGLTPTGIRPAITPRPATETPTLTPSLTPTSTSTWPPLPQLSASPATGFPPSQARITPYATRNAPHTYDIIYALVFSPAGEQLAVSAGDAVYLYAAATLAEQAVLPVGSWAGGLAYRPGAAQLALARQDGVVQFWDLATAAPLCQVDAHLRGAAAVAFSPDGTRLLSAGNDGILRLWDLTRLAAQPGCGLPGPAQVIGGAFAVPAVAFSPAGDLIASAEGRVVRLRDPNTRRLARALPGPSQVTSLAFSPAGDLLATGEFSGTVRLWAVPSGQELGLLARPGLPVTGRPPFVWGVAFSPDGRRVAAGYDDGQLVVWDLPGGAALVNVPAHHGWALTALAYSPAGDWLVTGGLDAVVRFWNLP